MLKGRSRAVVFSILLHLIIILLVAKTVVMPPMKQNKPAPIKSFLYIPPKPVEPKPVVEVEEELSIKENKPEPEVKTKQEELAPQVTEPEVAVKEEDKQVKEASLPPVDKEQAPPAKPSRSFSPLHQLNNLSKSLDAQLFERESYQFSRKKSGSIMDGEPELVPHSTKQYSAEEKREQASYQLDSGMKTIKGDDGTCFIERDLSAVGIEGVKSMEAFGCGQSKFDKNFKNHMNKVLKKLGKK